MSYEAVESVFVIREFTTYKLLKFGSKCGWASVGAAKNAFNLHMKGHFGKDWSESKGLFDSQDQFIIQEVG